MVPGTALLGARLDAETGGVSTNRELRASAGRASSPPFRALTRYRRYSNCLVLKVISLRGAWFD